MCHMNKKDFNRLYTQEQQEYLAANREKGEVDRPKPKNERRKEISEKLEHLQFNNEINKINTPEIGQ